MRIAIAVVGGVVVRWCDRNRLDDRIKSLLLTGRNVRVERIIELLGRNDRGDSGRCCHAIEAEHRFLIYPAGHGCCLSRLCGLHRDRCGLCSVQ